MRTEPIVLLVEDEPLLRELMTEALIDQGFEVLAAHDAGGALRHLLSGADVDVLFTDIDLGGGMDGVTLARIVHEMRPRLPIVCTSGRRSMQQIASVPDAVFLAKPYSIDDVGATLERLIAAAAKRGRGASAAATPPSRPWPETAPASGYGSPR